MDDQSVQRDAHILVTYCFARPTHTYLDFDAGRDFESEIVVKVNTPEVARAELMRPSWKHEHVALGTNTDPYQWVEGRYQLMPGIWEAMRDSRTPSSVLTKSPLLLRDIELMKQIHEASPPTCRSRRSTSEAWRASEPHTPHPRKRIEAVAELNRGDPLRRPDRAAHAGHQRRPSQVEEILELCGEAGAVNIGGICLHLRGEVRQIFMDWLASYRPDLVPRYERLYARGAYAPQAERDRSLAPRRDRRGRRGSLDPPRPRRDPAGGRGAARTRSRRWRRRTTGAGAAVLTLSEPVGRRAGELARLGPDGLELARLDLAPDLGVDLVLAERRELPGLDLAADLALAEAAELEDLEHDHEVDARGDGQRANAAITSVQPACRVPSSSE